MRRGGGGCSADVRSSEWCTHFATNDPCELLTRGVSARAGERGMWCGYVRPALSFCRGRESRGQKGCEREREGGRQSVCCCSVGRDGPGEMALMENSRAAPCCKLAPRRVCVCAGVREGPRVGLLYPFQYYRGSCRQRAQSLCF